MKVIRRLAYVAVLTVIGSISMRTASETAPITRDESSLAAAPTSFIVHDYVGECGIAFAAPDSWQVFRVEEHLAGYECFFHLIPDDWANRRDDSPVKEPEIPFLIYTARNVDDPQRLYGVELFEGQMRHGLGLATEISGETWTGYETIVQVSNHDKATGAYAGYGEHFDAGIWSPGGTTAYLFGHGAYGTEFNQILASVKLTK